MTEEPVLLYRAAVVPGIRVLILVLAGLASMVPAAALCLAVAVAMSARDTTEILVAVGGAVVIASLLIGALVVIVRGAWSAFIVTTAGITVRGLVRTVRIPWTEVAVIQWERDLMRRGQAVVVTRSGQRIGSAVTSARFAMRRGESAFDHGPQLLHPAIPVRAAIDAHQRYLRGEFTQQRMDGAPPTRAGNHG